MFDLPREEHIPWLYEPDKYGQIIGQLYDLSAMEWSFPGKYSLPSLWPPEKDFDILGLSEQELNERFGFFLEAKYALHLTEELHLAWTV